MPISASITANSINLESISTISAILDQNTTVESCNKHLEDEIVYNLATEYTVNDIHAQTTQNIYTSSRSNKQFYANKLDADVRELFDITLPPSTNDGNFALSTQYVQVNSIGNDSLSGNVGNNINKSISIKDPTLSIYDSYLDISTNNNYGPFSDLSSEYVCTFDSANPANNIQRALNSNYNTTNNTFPLNVSEHVSFNTNYALAKDIHKYFTLDLSTGEPVVNDLPTQNRADLNGYTVESNISAVNENTQYGTYKITQLQDGPELAILKNNELFDPTDSDNHYDTVHMPFFNSNLGVDGSNNLPESITTDAYNTLFDTVAEPWVLLSGFKYTITAVDVSNSGYTIRNNGVESAEYVKDTTTVFSLDNTNLTDNYKYMHDFVSGNHELVFNDASVNIIPGSNGTQQNSLQAFSLTNDIETLNQSVWRDGEILLNINSPSTRIAETQNSGVDSSNILVANVLYNDEGLSQSMVGIQNDIKENKYVRFSNKLLVKNSNFDINYSKSNGASFNLFNNNKVVNDYFNSGEIQFHSGKSLNNNMVEIFRINTNQLLQTDSTGSIYDNTTNSVLADYSASGYLNNFTIMLNEQGKTLDKLQLKLTMKELNKLGLYKDASNALWALTNRVNIENANVETTLVSSSNSSAYSEDVTSSGNTPTTWPNQYPGAVYANDIANDENEIDSMLTTTTDSIFYTVSIIPSASYASAPNIASKFEAVVEWGKQSSDTIDPIKPWSVKRPATVLSQTSVISTGVEVPTSTYKRASGFSLPSAFNIKLIKYTSTITAQCQIPVGLLPYDNLSLTSPSFNVVYTYYSIQYTKTSSASAPKFYNSSQLKNIVSTDPNNPISYNIISYSIPEASVSSMSFSGKLSSDDFKELNAKVVALNDNNTVTDLTDTYTASSFYSVPLIMNLQLNYSTVDNLHNPPESGDIVINMGGSLSEPLWSENGYTVNFEVSGASNYSVDYFSSSVESLSSLIGNNTLTVANGYSNITDWSTTDYSVSVVSANGTTDVIIVDSSNVNVATITTTNFNFLNTQSFITYCNKDVWKVSKYLGESEANNTVSSSLVATNYTHGSNSNIFSIADGVYIVGNMRNINYETIPKVGYVYDFNLLADRISVNMIGSANSSLQQIDTLTYKYTNGDMKSKQLTLSKYRGYHGIPVSTQTYSIRRSQLVATFRINNGTELISQSVNVYKGTEVIINNLKNAQNVSFGGIGLKLRFGASVLNNTFSNSFPVFTKGDDVLIKIESPNYSGFSEINTRLSLLSYNLYNFSGKNYDNTGSSIKINSSRLKIKNTAFNYNKASYIVKIVSSRADIHFIPKYLGNPNDYSDWNNVNNLVFSQPYQYWLLQNNGGFGYNTPNMPNLHIQFSRTPNVGYGPSVSYIVCAPPHLHFVQRGNNVQEVNLPYNPATNASANTVHSYHPINSSKIYNPFAPRSVVLFNGQPSTVSFNSNAVNNITFTHNSSKSDKEYSLTPDASVKKIQVNGNYYTIKLYLGVKSSNTVSYITTIFNDTAEKLLALSPVETNGALTFVQSVNNSSGAVVSFLQPVPSFAGSTVSISEIFADKDIISNNITVEVGSFFLQVNNKLSLQILNGISVGLYTRKLSSDNSGNMFVHVYKYQPIANTVSDFSVNKNVSTIFYNSRKYKKVQVPGLFANNQTIPNWDNALASLNYTDLSNLVWTDDSAFNSTNTTIFASVVNLKQNASLEISPLIFAAEITGLIKVTMVNKQPILKIINKVGMPLIEIDANGVIQTPILSTNALVLQPPSISSINNSLDNYALYSTLKNTIDNVL